MQLRFWLRLWFLGLPYIVKKSKLLYQFVIFSLYTVDQRMGVGAGARTEAVLFCKVRTPSTWCGFASGSDLDLFPLAHIVKNPKIDKHFIIFSIYRPKDRGRSRSQNRSCIIFSCQNRTNMMRLLFWLIVHDCETCRTKFENWIVLGLTQSVRIRTTCFDTEFTHT
jgi:hypothetical protein